MKHSQAKGGREAGPTQRQLRAGELVRHALAAILREETQQDPALTHASVTVTEVRMSPDLKHAICFVEPLGAAFVGSEVKGDVAAATPDEVVNGLNRVARFLRGRLARTIELKFTPDLKFLHDETFAEAERMNRLFNTPEVRRDLAPPDDGDDA